MKIKTREKYIDFLRTLTANGTIYNVTEFARLKNIGDGFVSFLKKRCYLERMAGGSYKLKYGGMGFDHIINEYKNTTEKNPNTMVSNGDNLIQNTGGEIHFSRPVTMTEREQLAIDILGSIMRDNQHITYDLIRNERKETKTDLLKR